MTAAAPLLETLLARQFAAPELDWPALTAQLSAAARARLALMRADRRRQEFVLGRALAARLLHVAVGGGAWDLVPLANGKPVAVDAHGREHAAISLSNSHAKNKVSRRGVRQIPTGGGQPVRRGEVKDVL